MLVENCPEILTPKPHPRRPPQVHSAIMYRTNLLGLHLLAHPPTLTPLFLWPSNDSFGQIVALAFR